MRDRTCAKPSCRVSSLAVAFALLVGCGGGGENAALPADQPLSVSLSESATVLSVRAEQPASSKRTQLEAQAMNFAFAAQVDNGTNAGLSIKGRLELKGEREDDGAIEVEGRLFPDVDPTLPTPAELKEQFNADRKALRTAMREDIKVLAEELRAALAAGTPRQEAVAAFKAKFEQRMTQYREALSALIAEFRAARRAGQHGGEEDDDRAAKGFEVHGTIDANGAIELSVSLGDRGKVTAIGTIASDGTAKGTFTGPASDDVGSWSATASDSGQPLPLPTQGSYDAGLAKYTATCSGCHSAGKVDTSGTAGDLAGKADDLVSDLGGVDKAMSGLMLSAQDILDLKAFLRAANSPPPSGTGCATQNVTWSQGASTCNASYAGGASGTSAALADVTAPTTGTAIASCSNGTLTVSSPVCSTEAPPPSPPPAPCAAQAVTWSQGASTCDAQYPGGASGTSVALSDVIGSTNGTATATCSNGALSASAAVCSTTPTGNAAAGQAKYDTTCAGCHKAGAYDPVGNFSDLKGKQNNVVANLGSINAAMGGITLMPQEVLDLKAFLSQVQ